MYWTNMKTHHTLTNLFMSSVKSTCQVSVYTNFQSLVFSNIYSIEENQIIKNPKRHNAIPSSVTQLNSEIYSIYINLHVYIPSVGRQNDKFTLPTNLSFCLRSLYSFCEKAVRSRMASCLIFF